ncbi:MAG: hypothetical protein JSV32_03320 [Dehalococcoidia bacterium]|nr:MAG: hypothetical protein JSV32_03320 [Dehalococcoidia bacterium]
MPGNNPNVGFVNKAAGHSQFMKSVLTRFLYDVLETVGPDVIKYLIIAQ